MYCEDSSTTEYGSSFSVTTKIKLSLLKSFYASHTLLVILFNLIQYVIIIIIIIITITTTTTTIIIIIIIIK
jgi:hypothetical protein